MSLYRRISVRMWGDEKFLALSSPRPNAQTLWIYLFTGPHTGPVPGLFMAGEAGLAEALRWRLGDFRHTFQEIRALGMARADWTARLVFLPRAIVHNPPQSAKVVIGWRQAFEELPECPLKREAFAEIVAFLQSLVSREGMSHGYTKAFGEALPDSLSQSLPATLPDIAVSSSISMSSTPVAPPAPTALIGLYCSLFEARFGQTPDITPGKDATLLRLLAKQHGEETVAACLRHYLQLDADPFVRDNGHSLGAFKIRFNALKLALHGHPRSHRGRINANWEGVPSGEVKL